MQDEDFRPRTINWYRTPIDSTTFRSLHQKSDLLGGLQTLGNLAVVICTGTLAYYAGMHWAWWITLPLLFLHGTCMAFQINAVHELIHGTVFRTKALNLFFVRIFAFFGWNNYEHFQVSHARHHRYTLHQPDDLEVVLPIRYVVRQFLRIAFFNPGRYSWTIAPTLRLACGRFQGKWEESIFPEGSPTRQPVINWARFMLAGHATIILVSIWFHLWMLPVVTTFSCFYGEWLFFLCNNTQHIGLQDDVPDFRLCCRTFTLNPVVQFLYWHMNYHIEHHMYAAVPCYRLPRLHRVIQHDLPPSPRGLLATWREIAAIQKIQESQPDYQHVAPLPNAGQTETAGSAA